MSNLIPVIYREKKYPPHIKANIYEIAGNFDIENMVVNTPYSLHTEYSYGERRFSSDIISDIVPITSAQKNGIPQLWYNKKWARGFFIFVKRLIDDNKPPEILEIHPPFNDYCSSFDQFLDIFKVFYKKIKIKYPTTKIVIENRFGTRYPNGEFLLSKCSDVLKFCKTLSSQENSDMDLKIVLDYPQLFSSETKIDKKTGNWMGLNPLQLVEKIIAFNQEIKKYKELIVGFHMWGKCKDKNGKWAPHQGNFDTFFSNDNKLKNMFLNSVFSTFNDDVERYFVPEVNSGERDLHSIVADMEKYGFTFDDDRLSKAIKKSFVFRLPEEYLRNRKSGFIELKGWEIQFCFGKKDDKEYMYCSCDHRMTNCRYVCVYDDGTSEELVDPLSDEDPNNTKDVDYRKRLNEIKRELCKIKPVNKYDF